MEEKEWIFATTNDAYCRCEVSGAVVTISGAVVAGESYPIMK